MVRCGLLSPCGYWKFAILSNWRPRIFFDLHNVPCHGPGCDQPWSLSTQWSCRRTMFGPIASIRSVAPLLVLNSTNQSNRFWSLSEVIPNCLRLQCELVVHLSDTTSVSAPGWIIHKHRATITSRANISGATWSIDPWKAHPGYLAYWWQLFAVTIPIPLHRFLISMLGFLIFTHAGEYWL